MLILVLRFANTGTYSFKYDEHVCSLSTKLPDNIEIKKARPLNLTIIVGCDKRKTMGKNLYDLESQVETFHWWFVVRRRFLKSILSSIHLPSKIVTLDIGCGVGSNLRTLLSAGLNVIGIDRSVYALSLARKKNKFLLINGDLNNLPIRPKSVGLIIAADVLEHLDNDINGIHSLYHALENGGTLILTVPAFHFLWGIQDIVAGHKRRYTKQEILNKLRNAGFKILRSSYFNFFLFFPILLIRRTIHLLGLRIESENEINSPFVNFFLQAIFSLEPYILKYFSFPFGVSIFCIAIKK
jgi:SAM-dependent methyltransferase